MSSDHTVRSKARVYVLLLKQDDPQKCTAAKLVRLGRAKPLYRLSQIPKRALVLDPFAVDILLPGDKESAEHSGVVAVDCSWERADAAFMKRLPGIGRRLPTLLASNPVNYAKPGKLSSLEALAGTLYILGFKDQARDLLTIFKWGGTFTTLNHEPLEAYSQVTDSEGMLAAQEAYF